MKRNETDRGERKEGRKSYGLENSLTKRNFLLLW